MLTDEISITVLCILSSTWVKNGRTFTRKKDTTLITLFIWDLEPKTDSKITPRFITSGLVQGLTLPSDLISSSLSDFGHLIGFLAYPHFV